MSRFPDHSLDDRWILEKRGPRNPVHTREAYASLVEDERSAEGQIVPVATLFLTNRECPFRCLMCDLWKNTTEDRTPAGAIPHQISQALKSLPPANQIKLYNSGNFFDTKAIPPEDYEAIATLLKPFDRVIVECHPRLLNKRCLQFRDLLSGQLEVAIGLETAHPEVLSRMNKQMNLDDFYKAVNFLTTHDIRSRAFILLRPPFLSEDEGIYWANKTLDVAFEAGVDCAVIIPTRSGNGAMEWLEKHDYFAPPTISSLEQVMEYGLQHHSGRVFADLWDIDQFSHCSTCLEERKNRLAWMNRHQTVPTRIICSCANQGQMHDESH